MEDKLKESILILDEHNKWRRNDEIPNSIPMVDPKELGLAIDYVVNYFNKSYDCPICGSGMSTEIVKHHHCKSCDEHFTST